jgi:hypothetical protein
MTNTTDKFIDLLNESVFKAFGWETRIAKVPVSDTLNTIKSESITGNNFDTNITTENTTSSRVRKKKAIPSTTEEITDVGNISAELN